MSDKYLGLRMFTAVDDILDFDDIGPRGCRLLTMLLLTLLVLVLMVPRGTRLEVGIDENDVNCCCCCCFDELTLFRIFSTMGGKFSRQTIIGSSSTLSRFDFLEMCEKRSDAEGPENSDQPEEPAALDSCWQHSEKSCKKFEKIVSNWLNRS